MIAAKLDRFETNSISERKSCMPGRRVLSICVPNFGTKKISM